MDTTDSERPLDEFLEPGTTLMVGTQPTGGDLEFRPMTVARVNGSRIEMLLDSDEEWARAFTDGDTAFVTMADNRKNTWLSLKGRGSTSTEPSLIDELWNPMAGAYFD